MGFEGHFPGYPILPGVVLLGFLLEALREKHGPGVFIHELPSVRWRAPVHPGDSVELSGRGPSKAGRVSFEMRVGSTIACNGTAVVGWDRT